MVPAVPAEIVTTGLMKLIAVTKSISRPGYHHRDLCVSVSGRSSGERAAAATYHRKQISFPIILLSSPGCQRRLGAGPAGTCDTRYWEGGEDWADWRDLCAAGGDAARVVVVVVVRLMTCWFVCFIA